MPAEPRAWSLLDTAGGMNRFWTAFSRSSICDNPFPGGLFWLHRGEEAPLPRVVDFLRRAAEKGIDGGLVRD